MAITLDEYGFFDGVTQVDQVNWPRYMRPTQPDGVVCSTEVIAEYGSAMQVFANSSGMKVFVHGGFCYVRSHYAISRSIRELPIQPAHDSLSRTDLVVVRVRYGSESNSIIELDVVKGVNNSGPIPHHEAGVLWEMPLARVHVPAGATSIANGNITDARVFSTLPIEQGGTGARDKAQARANLGIKCGSRVVTISRIEPGETATVACQGLPLEGVVWIEPADASWEACNAAGVRYYAHSLGSLTIKATQNPGTIDLRVRWIGFS